MHIRLTDTKPNVYQTDKNAYHTDRLMVKHTSNQTMTKPNSRQGDVHQTDGELLTLHTCTHNLLVTYTHSKPTEV